MNSAAGLDAIIALQQQGKLDLALAQAKEYLAKHADDAEAYHLLGSLYAQAGDLASSIAPLEKAVALDEQVAIYHNHLANVYAGINKIPEALSHYHLALKLEPKHFEVMNNLGNLYYRQGDLQQAEQYYEQALLIAPFYEAANFNLANLLSKQSKYKAAQKYYEQVLKTNPEHSLSLYNLGLIQRLRGQLKDALKTYFKYIELHDDDPDGYYFIALTYTELGSVEEAIGMYQKLLKLKPEHPEANYNLGTLYHKLRKMDQALIYYHKALALDPTNTAAEYLIAALEAKADFDKAPSDYLTFLFNQYAPNYEQHLVNDLKYKLPKLVEDCLSTNIKAKTKSLSILDLGCGSGLLGPILAPYAQQLIGLDLSEKMLHLAKLKQVYDELTQNDFLEYLAQEQQQFDLVVAAEVFIYFGDLEPSFALISQHLKPKANFIFSGEINEGDAPFQLQASGRFAHRLDYIEALAAKYNLQIHRLLPIATRLHEGEPNQGFFAWVSQPG